VLAVRTPWLGSTVRNPAVSELCTSHTEMAPLRQVAVRTRELREASPGAACNNPLILVPAERDTCDGAGADAIRLRHLLRLEVPNLGAHQSSVISITTLPGYKSRWVRTRTKPSLPPVARNRDPLLKCTLLTPYHTIQHGYHLLRVFLYGWDSSRVPGRGATPTDRRSARAVRPTLPRPDRWRHPRHRSPRCVRCGCSART